MSRSLGFFFFSSRRRHTRFDCDWSSDVCSSDLKPSGSVSPPAAAFGAAPDVGAFDPNLQMPTVHEWSLTVQRQLPLQVVVQVGYIGKRGTHLFRAYDLNQLRTDQVGFLSSYMIARQNVLNGCNPDGTTKPKSSWVWWCRPDCSRSEIGRAHV